MYRVLFLVAESPDGRQERHRLTAEQSLAIVAATNFKQRTRKMLEYYHADRLNYRRRRNAEPARVRPGLLRQERRRRRRRQADRPPLQDAGLPARGVPRRPGGGSARGLRRRIPIHCRRARRSSTSRCPTRRWICASTRTTPACRPRPSRTPWGCRAEDVERVFRDIEQKRRTTRYLHLGALLVEPVDELKLGSARLHAGGIRARASRAAGAGRNPPRGPELLERRQLVGCELDRGGRRILAQVREVARSGNRDEGRRAVQEPGERDLGRRRVVRGGDAPDRVVPALRKRPLQEREPGDEGDAGLLARAQQVLVLALGEVVAILDGCDRDDSARLLELREIDVRDSDMLDLALRLRSSDRAPIDSSNGTAGSGMWK